MDSASLASLATYLGGIAGAFYLLELFGVLGWIRRKVPALRRRHEPLPDSRFFTAPRLLEIGGLAVAAGLVFVPWLAAKIALVCLLIALAIWRQYVIWRREQNQPLASRLMTDAEVTEAKWQEHQAMSTSESDPLRSEFLDSIGHDFVRGLFQGLDENHRARKAADHLRGEIVSRGHPLISECETVSPGTPAFESLKDAVGNFIEDVRDPAVATLGAGQTLLPREHEKRLISQGGPADLKTILDRYVALVEEDD